MMRALRSRLIHFDDIAILSEVHDSSAWGSRWPSTWVFPLLHDPEAENKMPADPLRRPVDPTGIPVSYKALGSAFRLKQLLQS